MKFWTIFEMQGNVIVLTKEAWKQVSNGETNRDVFISLVIEHYSFYSHE